MTTRSLAQPISFSVILIVGSPLSPLDQLIELIQNCLDAYEEDKEKLIDLIIDLKKYSLKIFDEGRGFGFDEDNEETQNTSCIMPTRLSKNRGGDNRVGGFHKGAFHSHLSSKAKKTIIYSKNTKNYKTNQTIINGEKIRNLMNDTDTNHSTLSSKIESEISPVIYKDEEGFVTYTSPEKTGIPLIDEKLKRFEQNNEKTGSLTHSTFNENEFPYTAEWLKENLPALMARFPFDDIKLKLTIIHKDDREEKEENSVDYHPLYNGELKDDYALQLTFKRFVLSGEEKEGLNEKQKKKLPAELLQLQLQRVDETEIYYFRHSTVRKKYTFATSHLKGDDEWYNGYIDDTEISYASLYTEDDDCHYEVTMNCLGHEWNKKQIKQLGGKKGNGYSPFMNLMDKSLTGIGPEKSYVATKILKGCRQNDGYRLKTRTQIKLKKKGQYTACGVGGRKNSPIIDETHIDPFVLSIYGVLGKIWKLLDTIVGIKPTTMGSPWSPMQDRIFVNGADEETAPLLFDFDTIIKQLGDKTHNLLRRSELGKKGWYKPWDTVIDCLVLSEPESNDSDEVEEDNEVEEDEAEEKVEENVIDEDDEDVTDEVVQQEDNVEEDEDVTDEVESPEEVVHDNIEDILTNGFVEEEDGDENQSRVQLIVTESDEESGTESNEAELPISDNTTIPSHNRLCSKTAANARDALPHAWPKMSRNERMKNFNRDWLPQLTCDEMYTIVERIIAKQCNIDENAKLCGAATLVSLANSEEIPSNSDSE